MQQPCGLIDVLFVLGIRNRNRAKTHAEIYYLHNDHLGNPQAVTDENRNIVWQGEYSPFGELVTETGTLKQPHRFPGQHADPETGLYYNYFRDYDPSLGRYVQSDPIGVMRDFSDPQMQVAIGLGVVSASNIIDMSPNQLYVYVMNNPQAYHDFYGLLSCDDKRQVCRINCRKQPHISGACFEKCEGKYGALSNCEPEPEPEPKPENCPDEVPEPDPLTPDCTFEKWKKGECGQ